MNPALSDEMVADMDATANFMHTTPPPFPTVESAVGIPVTGAAQGLADSHRRDAIRRGGI